MMVQQNKWRASRFGGDARLVDSDDYQQYSVQQMTDHLIELLQPQAQRFHCVDELEFATTLPGASRLELELLDDESWLEGGDCLIGRTSIDLEDRWCSADWRLLGGRKPLETRPLFHARAGRAPVGFVDLVRTMTAELTADLEHTTISGDEVMEEYNRVHGSSGGAVAPFVFVSAMGLEHALTDWRQLNFTETYVEEATPGSWVVNAVKEYPDGRLMWLLEVQRGLFPRGRGRTPTPSGPSTRRRTSFRSSSTRPRCGPGRSPELATSWSTTSASTRPGPARLS